MLVLRYIMNRIASRIVGRIDLSLLKSRVRWRRFRSGRVFILILSRTQARSSRMQREEPLHCTAYTQAYTAGRLDASSPDGGGVKTQRSRNYPIDAYTENSAGDMLEQQSNTV